MMSCETNSHDRIPSKKIIYTTIQMLDTIRPYIPSQKFSLRSRFTSNSSTTINGLVKPSPHKMNSIYKGVTLRQENHSSRSTPSCSSLHGRLKTVSARKFYVYHSSGSSYLTSSCFSFLSLEVRISIMINVYDNH